MAGRYSIATTSFAFLIACNHHSVEDMAQPSGDPSADTGEVDAGVPGGDAGPADGADGATDGGSDADGGQPAVCPVGAASWVRAVGLVRADQRSDVAVDTAGSVLFATKAAGGGLDGLTKLSASGEVLFTRPFGSVVATDRAGNAYIAGSFTEPLDVGLGVMQPEGNIDAFVAKLDADGHVVFARPLRLCGDGLEAIAVDATGRIAVSGAAMGTAVLAPDGALQFVVPLAGRIAFNGRGDLVIAGSFNTTIDLGDGPISAPSLGDNQGFVIALDRTGQRLFSLVVPGHGVLVNGVAVDGKDNIVFGGYYTSSIVLFGEEFRAIFAGESGRVTGAFIAAVDATGAPVWKVGRAPGSEGHGIATAPDGNAILTGATTGNAGFFRITQVTAFDATGQGRGLLAMAPASGYGRAFGAAADACATYVTVNALDLANPTSALRAYVIKLAR